MRRSVTYLLGCCVALLCSCAERDVLVDGIAEAETSPLPISFTNSYVDNAVTRHANALSSHQPTMGVWGWHTDGAAEKAIFTDQQVTYDADSAAWLYSPLRYWDAEARYTFYAYAPHQSHTTAEVSIDSTTKHIAIRGVKMHGHNLQAVPSHTPQELFVHTPDTDWMVSRSGQAAMGDAVMEVEFTMQHILSKFNICVEADTALLPSLSSLTADSIVVGMLAAQADFDQKLNHTPLLNSPAELATEEWTVTAAPDLYIRGTHPSDITDTPLYLVEALVIPQVVDPNATITLYYTYQQADGHAEECRYQLPIRRLIDRFVAGYDHTLTLVIGNEGVVAHKGIVRYED